MVRIGFIYSVDKKAGGSPRQLMLLTVIAVPGCTVPLLYHNDAFAQIS